MSRPIGIGLPPGTPVYIGDDKELKPLEFKVIRYDFDNIDEHDVGPEDIQILDDKTNWINVKGVHEVEKIKFVGKSFNIDPIILEDIVDTTQRPKFDDFEDYIHIVMKSCIIDQESLEIETMHHSFIMRKNNLLSFEELGPDHFELIRNRIRNNKGPIRRSKTDYLLLRLIDTLVDNYFVVLEPLREEIEELDEEVILDPSKDTLAKIQFLKRKMLEIKRLVFPMKEILNSLLKQEDDFISPSSVPYLHSILDHVNQIIETIDAYRELLSNQLDIYLSSVSNRMNDIMMFLTLITSIFIPLSFIAGLYGMNFIFMPELQWRYGYPLVLLIMVSIAVSMVLYFYRKGWLKVSASQEYLSFK